MIKCGIKLWSINKDLFRKVTELCKEGGIDFVELYIVPDSLELKELEILKEIFLTIHSPHFEHGFNIFELDSFQIKLFKNQVIETANFLRSPFIVLHSGIGENSKIFKKNVTKIYDKRILIENMPKVAIDGRTCFGYSLKQLNFIKKEYGLDICLDLTHAIESAVSQKLDYKDYVKLLIADLKPFYFHISGGEKNNEKDEHLNLFEGDFDLKWIKKILVGLAENRTIYLVFEVPKEKKDLENDFKNINYFKFKC